MNLVIVESPYAGDIERNTAYARRCLRHCLDRGEAPLASHLLYTQPDVLDDSIPAERERGIQAGYEWMYAADKIVFYVDLGWSPGMLKALKMARLLKRPTEVRRFTPYRSGIVPPPEVEDLLKAGIIEPMDESMPGVLAYVFKWDE